MTLWVGTSGWQYASWIERFYPEGVPQRRWLEHYAQCFRTVELNSTFYRLPAETTFSKWDATVPDDFVFAVKASRYLSHLKRLQDPADAVARLLDHAQPLRHRIGAVLVQLPPNLQRDDDRLASLLEVWPDDVRLAVEFRHDSWFDDDVFGALADQDAAMALTDRDGRPLEPLEATASWGYVRLHHGTATPRPCYGDTAMRSWIERCRSLWPEPADVFFYFNNDPEGCAVRDAARFGELAAGQGLDVTRTVDRRAVHVG